mgnify:CR=1 FL=1|jgi:hypothetical protein
MKRTTVREICSYYGQNYDNVKHMKQFIKQLKKQYKDADWEAISTQAKDAFKTKKQIQK